MPLNVNKLPKGEGGPQQPLLDPGTYPVRLVQVVDLGLQNQRPYKGQEKSPKYELYLTYEFLDEFCVDEDGEVQEDRPRWLSERISLHNLKADKAKSTLRYMALDPNQEAEGDWSALIGRPVNLTVVQNKAKVGDRIYMNVGALSPMRPKEAAKAPELVNEPKLFSLDSPDLEVFDSFPEFLQEIIKENLEFKGSILDKELSGGAQEKEDSQEEDNSDEW